MDWFLKTSLDSTLWWFRLTRIYGVNNRCEKMSYSVGN